MAELNVVNTTYDAVRGGFAWNQSNNPESNCACGYYKSKDIDELLRRSMKSNWCLKMIYLLKMVPTQITTDMHGSGLVQARYNVHKMLRTLEGTEESGEAPLPIRSHIHGQEPTTVKATAKSKNHESIDEGNARIDHRTNERVHKSPKCVT